MESEQIPVEFGLALYQDLYFCQTAGCTGSCSSFEDKRMCFDMKLLVLEQFVFYSSNILAIDKTDTEKSKDTLVSNSNKE